MPFFIKPLTSFEFEKPDRWNCQVVYYSVQQSELHINVQQLGSEKALTIVFVAVAYFEGPLTWHGAEFGVEPDENCSELLHRVGETQLLLEHIKLFTARIFNVTNPD